MCVMASLYVTQLIHIFDLTVFQQQLWGGKAGKVTVLCQWEGEWVSWWVGLDGWDWGWRGVHTSCTSSSSLKSTSVSKAWCVWETKRGV